jgi:hypothetical protein
MRVYVGVGECMCMYVCVGVCCCVRLSACASILHNFYTHTTCACARVFVCVCVRACALAGSRKSEWDHPRQPPAVRRG